MKKIFTLALALMGFAGAVNAASVNDIEVCKHSYVLVCDDYTNNGTEGSRIKGGLFGDNYFLDINGGSVSTGKGSVDLSVVDALGPDGTPLYVTEDIVAKYGEYGAHLNSLRLKNTQDMIAMRPTAGSKIIFFLQGNNKTGKDARYPKLSKKADLSDALNPGPTADFAETTVSGFKLEFTVPNDWGTEDILYIGSYNGDMFLSYIIVEAQEAEGTPSIKVGPQTFENGLYYREVICKTVKVGADNTIATYTTDGSTPNENSPVYTEPIKCYANQTVKFQAYYDFDGDGKANADYICEGADNEANVNFSFDAPVIESEGANVTITSPYEGAKNFYAVNGGEAVEGSTVTLTESATVSAYSQIINGSYATFTSKSALKDVYVLNPIKEKKTIAVIAGDVVLDEEATATSTTGEVYKVENGAISVDKADFFVKNVEFAVIKDAEYQIDGQEIYIKMNNTNITFQVAEGDSVNVKVVCSKNSCKTLNSDDESKIDRKCYVNVSGTTYGTDDITAEGANVIEFGLTGGTYTFQKYSGTGNIFVSSIEIDPVESSGIHNVQTANAKNAVRYNLAGVRVNNDYKGLVIVEGKKLFVK